MQLQPYSYNGTLINDGTNYISSIVGETQLQAAVSPIYVKRAGARPVFAGKDFLQQTLQLEITCQGAYNDQLETLNKLFDVHDVTERKLIVQDISDSNTQYYIYCTAFQMSPQMGTDVIVSLAVGDPIWRSETESSLSFSVTSDNATTDIVVGGNIEAYPTIEVTPTAYAVDGYIYTMYIQLIPESTKSWSNRPTLISQSTDGLNIDTAALVTAGKVQADGDDFRVLVDGLEVDRWFGSTEGAFNTTNTKVWINLNIPAAFSVTLGTAIGSTDSISTIDITWSKDFQKLLAGKPTTGFVIIDSEEFYYTGISLEKKLLKFLGVTRSARNSAGAAHLVGAVIYFMPYDIQIVYGYPTETAPEQDDTRKPIIDLSLSTLSSFVYDEFSDDAGLRSGIWQSIVTSVSDNRLSLSDVYTATQAAESNPSSVAGMGVLSYQSGGVWRKETSTIRWVNSFPDLISSIADSYEVYRYTADFPTETYLYTSTDSVGSKLTKGVKINSPSAVQTWETGSHATTDITLPTQPIYVKYEMKGSVKGTADNAAYFGVSSVTVNLINIPTIRKRAEDSNFQFSCRITNTTTGKSIEVNYPVQVGQTLIIDTDPSFPNASYFGQLVSGSITPDTVRSAWLPLQPGTNTITYTADIISTLTMVIKWRNRYNYL